MDEATLTLLFESPSFPVRAFAARVKIPKDRLVAVRTGRRMLNGDEVGRLARACAKAGADAAEIARLELFIWDKALAATARCVEKEKLEARLKGGAS